MTIVEQKPPSPEITHEEVVAQAASLAPVVRAHIVSAELERRQPEETIRQITNAGLVRLLIPKRWGGYEMPFDAMVDSVLEVAKIDASAGWCYSFLIIHAWLLSLFPDEAQRDVWATNPDTALVAATFPSGQPIPTQGGYRLSGNWPWLSGINHCDWAMVLTNVPTETGSGKEMRLFLVPKRDYRISDTWFAAGLKASGSNNIVIEDAFVPAHRTVALKDLAQGRSPGALVNTGPLYQVPLIAAFPIALATSVLGATMGAYETWRDHNRSKFTTFSHEQIAALTHQQIRLAETAAEIDAAEGLLRRVLGVLGSGQPVTPYLRVRTRRDYAYIATLCTHAVDRLYANSGGGANNDTHPMQRYWRDIHAMALHARLNFDPAAEGFGRMELGLSPNPHDPFA